MPTYAEEQREEREAIRSLTLLGATMLLFLVGLGMAGCPLYNVWEQGLVGEAAFKRAEQDRRIAVEEARAADQSAELLAQAEVKRAHGVAEANAIIGDSLKDNDAYLRYLWIQALSENDSDVIYVPTEANLPILEAGRFLEGKGE